MTVRGQENSPIGIATIWNEAVGIERVSLVAVVTHCVRQAYENVRRSGVTSLLTVVTIAVAIFLLGIFLLGSHNSSLAVSNERGEMVVMVFLKDSASTVDIQAISRQLQEMAPGRTVTFTDKGQALQSFRVALGQDATMLDGLDADNPLPASLQVQLSSADEAERVYGLAEARYAGSAKVESVRYSRGGVEQIKRMLRVVELVGVVGIVFLLVIAGFIIANTIKLALYNHRTEVEIMRLVGAKRAAICAPYLLEGFVQGVIGAALGLLGVFGVYAVTHTFLHKSEILQALFSTVVFIPLGYILAILLAGAIVGIVGSFLAVRRFLAES